MGYVFGMMMTVGLMLCLLQGSPETALEAMIAGAGEAVSLSLSLGGAYLLFLGLMRIAEEAGVMKNLSKRMSPLVNWLIPNAGSAAAPITLNLAANVLGLGNAATPFGLAAMRELQRNNRQMERATHGMCMFLCINASSIQLIPSTVLSLRAAAGSTDISAVILPTLIATTVSTLTAVLLCRLCRRAGL